MATWADGLHDHLGTWDLILDMALKYTEGERKFKRHERQKVKVRDRKEKGIKALMHQNPGSH